MRALWCETHPKLAGFGPQELALVVLVAAVRIGQAPTQRHHACRQHTPPVQPPAARASLPQHRGRMEQVVRRTLLPICVTMKWGEPWEEQGQAHGMCYICRPTGMHQVFKHEVVRDVHK